MTGSGTGNIAKTAQETALRYKEARESTFFFKLPDKGSGVCRAVRRDIVINSGKVVFGVSGQENPICFWHA
mgnify:CR=1 FL=1